MISARSTHRPARGTLARILGILVLALLVGEGGPVPRAGAATSGPLTVFAAASLTEAFSVLGKLLERRNPALRVTFNFAGSQQLALQLEQGARADIFASADQRWMDYARQRGLISGAARDFVRNALVVIVPQPNPARISQLQDLARPGVKLVLADEAVPVGTYTREALAKLSQAPGFGSDFAQRVLRNVVSEEDNVKGVVAKVQLGEADAGIVYRSDVTSNLAGRIQMIDIPARFNVIASYPIALVKGAPNPDAARQFLDLLFSSPGQRVLTEQNFIPVGTP